MQTRDVAICGSFTVETEDHQVKRVIICQDIVTHYDKEKSYAKYFRLESPSGIAVYRTDNPSLFQLGNGTLLKRTRR
ncbi:hypothetical protein [Desulfopila sp. IMCC35008]|uniref:hypothetical protein n=1 Tax=Desulfopila sp. IMCC35008 TaxID=2653858 RepID=UPI0013CFC713|nr:hypothetical protein [Desulfopila sp. IMCC35008]